MAQQDEDDPIPTIIRVHLLIDKDIFFEFNIDEDEFFFKEDVPEFRIREVFQLLTYIFQTKSVL